MLSRNMMTLAAILLGSLTMAVASVDDAIMLYETGDIPGAIVALESLVGLPDLSYDEQLRAWDRLGSAYYAMGDVDRAGWAYLELLKLDVHYDLNPLANPRLRDLLGQVRDSSMATAMVTTAPEGALITLDNELLGVTPMSLDGLLGGQQYDISVYSNGYQAESLVLIAQAGQLHDVSFTLVPVPETVQVAVQTDTTQVVEPSGGASDISTILGTSQQVAASGQGNTDAQSQVSTSDLVNILTSGGGFDMAALASSGALSSQRATSGGIAGAERVAGSIDTTGQAPSMAQTDLQSLMIFSDPTSSTGDSADGGTIPGSSRSSEEIMEVLAEKRGSVTFIYNKHLRNDPMLMGTVVVEMVIEPSGRVSHVDIAQSNTYNPAFELELARTIETWRFGAVDENEGSLTVQYPFTFSQ
jgi:TonB family protein